MILYIETNFIIGAAKGQVKAYDDAFLQFSPDRLQIVLPAPCVAEAVYSMERLRKQQSEFSGILQSQITELERDQSAQRPHEALKHMNSAALTFAKVFEATERRFRTAMEKLIGIPAGPPRAQVIPLTGNSISARMLSDGAWYGLQPPLKMMDYLILCAVLDHAGAYPNRAKIFLSGNERDFRRERGALKGVGVDYVTDAAKALARVISGVPAGA